MGHRANIEYIAVWICFGFYAVNYTAGWLLHFKVIKMTKLVHRFLFAGVLITLTIVSIYENMFTLKFLLAASSLVVLFALPFGIKGGKYHILIGSTGFLIYVIFLLTYFKIL